MAHSSQVGHFKLPREPKYKTAIEDATEQTERDRQTPNKLQWEGKCQKITEAGIFCGDRSKTLCDQIYVSLLYLNIGSEGRRLLTKKFLHDNIYDLLPLKLWEMLEIALIRLRKITFDRYVFNPRNKKRAKRKTIFILFSRNLQRIAILKIARRQSLGIFSSPKCLLTISSRNFYETQWTIKELLTFQSKWRWVIRTIKEFLPTITTLESMWYNNSPILGRE